MEGKVKVYGERLVEERKKQGISQQTISEKTGIPLSTYKLYESEFSKVPASRLELISNALDKPEDYFMKRHNKVVAVMLHKGGCGKTTTAVNISYALSEKGYKILCIDADMQMNLSRQYGFSSPGLNNFETVMRGACKLEDAILQTNYPNLDIVTAAYGLATMEADMIEMRFREYKVMDAIDSVKEKYDFIFIDTNPTLGLLNSSILFACDEIIVPVMPTDFGMAGLEVFTGFYHDLKMAGAKANIMGILLNNIDFRKGITEVMFEQLENLFGSLLFNNFISTDSNVDNSQLMQQPVLVYNPRSRASKDYRNVAQEIIKKIEELE